MELVVKSVMKIVMNHKESWKLHIDGMPDKKKYQNK
jgi:hypothetical protein